VTENRYLRGKKDERQGENIRIRVSFPVGNARQGTGPEKDIHEIEDDPHHLQ